MRHAYLSLLNAVTMNKGYLNQAQELLCIYVFTYADTDRQEEEQLKEGEPTWKGKLLLKY